MKPELLHRLLISPIAGVYFAYRSAVESIVGPVSGKDLTGLLAAFQKLKVSLRVGSNECGKLLLYNVLSLPIVEVAVLQSQNMVSSHKCIEGHVLAQKSVCIIIKVRFLTA